MQLILGTAQLTRPYGILHVDAPSGESPHDILHEAKKSGFGAIDTAPVYGEAERAIGDARLGMRIHTKIDPSIEGLVSIRQSLKRLNIEALEVVYLHEAFNGCQAQVDNLSRIRDQSLDMVTSLGVSIYKRQEFEAAMGVDLVTAIQLPFNVATVGLTERDFIEAQANGKKIYVRSIFLQGVLTAEPDRLPRTLSGLRSFVREFQLLTRRWGISPAQGALAFVRSHAGLNGLVVGANSVADVRDIGSAFSTHVESGFIEDCRNLLRPPAEVIDPRTW